MFVKIATVVALMSTSFTGTAVVIAEPGDTLYPIKAEIQETIQASYDTNMNITTKTNTRSDGFIKVYGDMMVNTQ